MNDDINTKRTELANQMAAAGAAVLDFNGTAAALAAIPDTEPQQYVAAGTPENIAAILPATICPQRRQKHGERPSADDLEWGDAATSGDAPADLQQLKALALAATPGPWNLENDDTSESYPPVAHVGQAGEYGLRINVETFATFPEKTPKIGGPNWRSLAARSLADAAYIAAANPAVVLDLIARIEKLQAGVRHD